MRKFFLSMAAVAALLTSCSKDETTTAAVEQRSMVTFTVNAPELSTRADNGDGTTATQLEYVIYDLAEAEGHNQIYGTADFSDNSDGDDNPLTTTVEVNLVEGREYEAIFFAHAPESPYTFNRTEQTMTLNTTSLDANAEEYDAFYKYVEPFEIEAENFSVDVEMKRPFAQLNVATNDATTPAGAMIDAETTGVEVEAYNTLNFKDGTVSGKETIHYALADKMEGTIKVGETDYSWLTMNYILVNTQETVGVKFLFTDKDKDNNVQTYEREYSAVPVERNHKTNIIGSILTSTTEFKVTIAPGFEDPEHIYDVDNTEEVTATVTSLQDAINEAIEKRKKAEKDDPNLPPTTVIFKLTEDGNVSLRANNSLTTRASYTVCENSSPGAIVIDQFKGLNFVIDGDGITFDGTFDIHGNAAHTGEETLTFTNINFKHDNGAIDFISCNTIDSHKRYAHNVTIENCTFTGNTNGDVVGLRFRQCYDIRVVNSTFTNMHSLMWATGTSGITLDGVTVTDSKSGVSFGTSTNVVVKNSNITANTDHGIRADGSVATTLTINNTSINASVPVIVRKATAAYNVVLEGKNNITSTGLYDVIFTSGEDDADYVAPTAKWSITGAEGLNVYPTAAESGEFNASSNTQLSQAIAAGATTVNLAKGTYSMPSTGGKSVTITGTEDAVIKANTSNLGGGNLTLEGVTIEAGSYNGFQHSGVVIYNDVTVNGQLNLYGTKDIFNDCTFNLTNTYVWTYGSDYTEFNNCTFNTTGKAILIYNEGAGACDVKVEGCTFNATAGATAGAIANQNCAAIEIDNYAKMSHKLTTSNNNYSNNFSGEWRIKSYVEDAPVTVNGVEYTSIAIDGKEMTIDANKNVTVVE